MSRPLRSTPITGASPLLRVGPPAGQATVLNASRICRLTRSLSPTLAGCVKACLPKFRVKAAAGTRDAYTPDAAWPVSPPGHIYYPRSLRRFRTTTRTAILKGQTFISHTAPLQGVTTYSPKHSNPSPRSWHNPVASLPPSASEAVGAAVAQNATTQPTHRRHPNRRSRNPPRTRSQQPHQQRIRRPTSPAARAEEIGGSRGKSGRRFVSRPGGRRRRCARGCGRRSPGRARRCRTCRGAGPASGRPRSARRAGRGRRECG